MTTNPTVDPTAPDDPAYPLLGDLLRYLHPGPPTVQDVIDVAERHDQLRALTILRLPSRLPSASPVARVPTVVAMATMAMEIALWWLRAVGLLGGEWAADLDRRLAGLVADAIEGVKASLGEPHACLYDDLVAAVDALTTTYHCAALRAAIGDALAEATGM
jgi:hypothetical protein